MWGRVIRKATKSSIEKVRRSQIKFKNISIKRGWLINYYREINLVRAKKLVLLLGGHSRK